METIYQSGQERQEGLNDSELGEKAESQKLVIISNGKESFYMSALHVFEIVKEYLDKKEPLAKGKLIDSSNPQVL